MFLKEESLHSSILNLSENIHDKDSIEDCQIKRKSVKDSKCDLLVLETYLVENDNST